MCGVTGADDPKNCRDPWARHHMLQCLGWSRSHEGGPTRNTESKKPWEPLVGPNRRDRASGVRVNAAFSTGRLEPCNVPGTPAYAPRFGLIGLGPQGHC